MSWHYSRALEGAFSAASCSDGGPSARSNSTTTPAACSSPDRTTDALIRSQSGTTSGLSEAVHGEALLTWFLAASRARTSASQEREKESTGPDPDSGEKWRGSLAKWDRDSSSWKTAQLSLLGGWEPFSETWPRWGMMRDGECWELAMPALRTDGTESGSWPTPVATDGSKGGRITPRKSKEGGNLIEAISNRTIWATPTVQDGNGRTHHNQPNGSKTPSLLGQVIGFPTPCAQDAKNSTLPVSQRDRDSIPGALLRSGQAPGGQLNPTWVEWLMGWPLGWTDCAASETDRFLQWRLSHGEF